MPARTSNDPPLHRHRDKRPYHQQPITTFFDVDEGIAGPTPIQSTTSPPRKRHDSIAPILPPTVQANLLTVGMRVRKSVPEGYKTHKPASLPTIQTQSPPREPVPSIAQHPRELLPFCGLHKIGGFAEQPVTNVHLYGGGAEAEVEKPVTLFPLPAEAFNTPFSATVSAPEKKSNDSTLNPNPANPYKRSWEEEEGKPISANSNFIFAFPVGVSEDDVPVSPLSSTPVHSLHTSMPQAALRPFAQPKTRRQNGGFEGVRLGKEHGMEIDVENADERAASEEMDQDFKEADFLKPWGGGKEVEMGGV